MRRALTLAVPLTLAAASLASATPPYSTVRCDPACNVRVTHAQGPANEVALAADPTDPDNVIAAAKDYSNGTTGACDTYNVWAGIYHSTDGGRTWGNQLLARAGLPAGTTCISDPVLAYGPEGTAYYFGLAIGPPQGARLFVERSLDKGATWQYRAEIARTADKQWAGVDPGTGRVWVAWVDTSSFSIQVATSADGGATWQRKPLGSLAANVARGPGPAIAVGPAPAGGGPAPVYLAWRELASGAMMLATSADGGATWTARPAVVSLSAGDSTLFNTRRGYRYFSLPSLGVDTGSGPNRGSLYMAYADLSQSRGEVRVAHSRDGGITWATVPVEPPSPDALTSDEFMPALAVSPRGDVHVFAYSTRDADPGPTSGLLDVHYSHSADGVLWDPPIRVTTVSSDPQWGYHQRGFEFIGDYIGAAAAGDVAYGAWADMRNERSDVYAAAVPR